MIIRTETRAAEIKMAEANLQGLLDAQYISSMSDDFYYSNGSKSADDLEIRAARLKLEALKKDQV
ncbi:hypothetical protein OLZ32_27930 [Rhizobium sp. 1AS11]|uniref:hypothetical protein n=1 Tax=Rhizobium acaciae TaxID=2989736 RepID=UPI002222A053|nr:hypothetical protein [Rhizobium acaciae]MCW1412183.1 hypothetical protein [Rhizobium acaciae]MCW1744198.1 hypothetical protein [Rhizobium acaciae]